MIEQHHLLNTVADLIDSKKIKTTLTDLLSPISAENLRKALKKIESGNTNVTEIYVDSPLALNHTNRR
jgi:DNA topoisomerase VI subunit B